MPTALVYEAGCLAHDNGSMILEPRAASWLDVPHVESPERVARTFELLGAAGLVDALESLPGRQATEEELRLVHSAEHVERIRVACEADELQWVGPEARAGSASWEPGLIAAGSALAALEWVLEAGDRRAYVLTRPPGHHSSADQAMGFCLFNNVALAARRARQLGVERVAIVDWDVHHGNGTEDVFAEDPAVLFTSLHQEELYPVGRGRVEHRGRGAGLGTTVNVPLPAGSGDATYLRAVREVVLPVLESFAPELLLLSSGQDAAASDPLGRMSVSTEGFRAMTAELVAFAAGHCDGRLLALQEGGYSPDHMPFCVLATIEALAGREPSFERDPMELDLPLVPQPYEDAAIRKAVV